MNTKTLQLLICLTMAINLSLSAQDIPKTREIILETENGITKADVLINAPLSNRQINIEYHYSSYYKETIFKTQGGHYGHLLHGPYREFYADHSPKVEGEHRFGLSHGEWKTWNKNGKLKSFTSWRNGVKHGTFRNYDAGGQITEEGQYKNGQLHGSVVTYKKGEKEKVTRYRNGKERKARVKKSKNDIEQNKEPKAKGQ